jgi:hypothetical protein
MLGLGSGVLTLGGCGGGGGATPANVISVPRGTRLTSANESQFSADAVILVEQTAKDPFLSAYDAAVIDADLSRIRKEFPQVAAIHARPDYVDREILVGVFSGGSPLAQQWFNQGLPSTQGPLRDVLTTYGAQDLQYQGLADFLITFSDPVNIPAVAKLMLAASSDIRYAEPNGIIGDGDRIILTIDVDSRSYAFSHGWGDCIGGCISRHTWTFNMVNGKWTLTESGAPIPPDGGRAVNTDLRPKVGR